MAKLSWTVYKMVNVDDRSERKGWVYIGYTHDRLSRRLCGNHRGLLHEDKDIAHYKFTIEAVAKFEDGELAHACEKELIRKHISDGNIYNKKIG